MIPKDNILTHEERATLKSMSTYWREVAKREDTMPLKYEIDHVYGMLGAGRLLSIVAQYIELTGAKRE